MSRREANDFSDNPDGGGVWPWMAAPEKTPMKKAMQGKRVFEYGAGGSTIYFGALAKEYYSIENNKEWYEAVKNKINLPHVKLFYEEDEDRYLQKIKEVGGNFDVVFVDNDLIHRSVPALASFDHLRDDGVLILHDSSRAWGGELKKEFEVLLTKYSLLKIVATAAFFEKKSKIFGETDTH